MTKFLETNITRIIEEDGKEIVRKFEKSTAITRNTEPDYIKIYTNMWSEFNNIPIAYRELFLQLAIRMTYCNADNLEDAQIVYTLKPTVDSIKRVLGWKNSMFYKGIGELIKSGAIRKISRGAYQINPQYAGKGEWKYNPRLKRGGVEELVATFKLGKDGEKTVKTEITWADDGEKTEFNQMYRDGLKVKASNETVLLYTEITPIAETETS